MPRLSSNSGVSQRDIEQPISKNEQIEDVTSGGDADSTEKEFEPQNLLPSEDAANGLRKTVTAQDWNGPDDPENPVKWSLWQRVYHTYVPLGSYLLY